MPAAARSRLIGFLRPRAVGREKGCGGKEPEGARSVKGRRRCTLSQGRSIHRRRCSRGRPQVFRLLEDAPPLPGGDDVRVPPEPLGHLIGREVLVTREGVRAMHGKHRVTSAKAERELGMRFRQLERALTGVAGWYRDYRAAPRAQYTEIQLGTAILKSRRNKCPCTHANLAKRR